ncbi:MAG: M48 family metallopeptidase [Proteobacteria bacterium]|nr:M48 family metallopeptidase [Pseudomonadota bacterium]
MTQIDFDFARYIAERRGQVEQRARDGGAYAFASERKFRRTLDSVRPVAIAIEATTRLWKNVAKTELLGTSVQVNDQQFPRVFQAVQKVADALRIEPSPVYIAPDTSPVKAQAFGTNDDAYVVINSQLLEYIDDRELLALLGHEFGHVQNNHVLYATALHYLTTSAAMFVRWVVQPAIMTLQVWSRRAEITCDRAALLATRQLDATLSALVKIALGLDGKDQVNIADYLDNLPDTRRGMGRYAELFRTQPYLPKRVQALRRFAESAFYLNVLGEPAEDAPSSDQVDAEVADLLSVF